jgi:hypothetical protein
MIIAQGRGGITPCACFHITRQGVITALNLKGAAGGTRTPTKVALQRILSPWRLPFRHDGLPGVFSLRDSS